MTRSRVKVTNLSLINKELSAEVKSLISNAKSMKEKPKKEVVAFNFDKPANKMVTRRKKVT